MFLLSLPFTFAHHTITYLYPLYASYKAITHQPPHPTTHLAEIETWLMYWSVVGAIQLLEGWAEWAWSWLPFYSLIKLIFTLWLVLPQTRGATLLYVDYLAPFLRSHEGDIDLALASAKAKASEAAGKWIMAIWQHVRSAILATAMTSNSSSGTTAPQSSSTHTVPEQDTNWPGTVSETKSASQLFGLLKHYGPLAAASVVSAIDKAAAQAAHATGTQPPTHLSSVAVAPAPATGPTSARTTAASSKGPTTSASGIAATRSRTNLNQSTRAKGTMAASAAATTSRSASSRLAAPPLASLSRPSASSSSDWSEEDEGQDDQRARLIRTKKRDLSGSYQLVGDDELGDGDGEESKETQFGGAATDPREIRSGSGSRSGSQSGSGTGLGAGGGAERGWASWLTGR